MDTELLKKVFGKFKMYSYHEMFKIWKGRETSLTTVETFCMEIIYSMGRPTVSEFAAFASLSSANAADKINKLISKGYLKKVRSEKDKRRYYLEPTQKYLDYYNIYENYIDRVMAKAPESFDKKELAVFYKILCWIDRELKKDQELSDIPAVQ